MTQDKSFSATSLFKKNNYTRPTRSALSYNSRGTAFVGSGNKSSMAMTTLGGEKKYIP